MVYLGNDPMEHKWKGKRRNQQKDAFSTWWLWWEMGSILLGPSEEPCKIHLKIIWGVKEKITYLLAQGLHWPRVFPIGCPTYLHIPPVFPKWFLYWGSQEDIGHQMRGEAKWDPTAVRARVKWGPRGCAVEHKKYLTQSLVLIITNC